MKEEPVKILGKWYAGPLSGMSRGVEIMKQTKEGLKAIDGSKLPGNYNIWCLQFGLYPRITWPLMIYEVALSRVEMMKQKCNTYIRKSEMAWPASRHKHFSSESKEWSPTVAFNIYPLWRFTRQAGKARTVILLRESNDQEVRSNHPDFRTARKWRAEEETNNIVSALEWSV